MNPFTLCAKLLRSGQNFYALKKLLKSWAQSVSLAQSVNGFMKLTHGAINYIKKLNLIKNAEKQNAYFCCLLKF